MNRKTMSTSPTQAHLGRAGIHQITGNHNAGRLKFGLVVSRFNDKITNKLLRSAADCLTQHGASDTNITVVWVPGAFEIPGVLEKMAQSGRYDALIALGAIVQGETPHAALISAEVNRSMSAIAQRHGLPVVDGVVMTHTMAQAEVRSKVGTGGRGWYAATVAIEMARVYECLKA